MNIYKCSGTVSFVRTHECECCGQDTEEEVDKEVSVEVESDDETNVAALALEKVQENLRKYYAGEDITGVEWGTYRRFPRAGKPKIVLVREVSEAELMRRAGAPMLF